MPPANITSLLKTKKVKNSKTKFFFIFKRPIK